jgi:L-alanine-DL-glutamate epimerase-like enolase superfamily enzyme
MKITGVKATTLKGYKQWNYIQIKTDEGLTGLGEAHPGEGIVDVILKQFKPMLVGRDPRDVEPLYKWQDGKRARGLFLFCHLALLPLLPFTL